LPHSSHWHITIPPQGILDPSTEAQQAIAQSTFFYIPQYAWKKKAFKPIRISGVPEKLQPIKDIIRALATSRSGRKAPLQEELDQLLQLAQEEPHYWHDRERLLIES
jgi:hypothetical protein